MYWCITFVRKTLFDHKKTILESLNTNSWGKYRGAMNSARKDELYDISPKIEQPIAWKFALLIVLQQ